MVSSYETDEKKKKKALFILSKNLGSSSLDLFSAKEEKSTVWWN